MAPLLDSPPAILHRGAHAADRARGYSPRFQLAVGARRLDRESRPRLGFTGISFLAARLWEANDALGLVSAAAEATD